MSFVSTVVTLLFVGVLLWLVNSYVPLAASIKRILNIFVVIVVLIWLLYGFGVLGQSGEVRLPEIR